MPVESLITPCERPLRQVGSYPLRDQHGRVIRKLRISLLDACNFRCSYCMPRNQRFAPRSEYLGVSELTEIVADLVSFGVEQIRVTGGEPTLRQDFREVMASLSRLPVQKLGLTTNGLLLAPELDFLWQQGVQAINISLDSLQAERFHSLTHSKAFDRVYATILKARDMGFQVKLNTVVIGGWNDDEIMDFVHFSEREQIEVRFLELMRIGQALPFQSQAFVSADQMLARITQARSLKPRPSEFDATAFHYTTASGGQLGFIASESRPFCGSCSRLRLSYDGHLRACLMLSEGRSLRQLSQARRREVLTEVMALKPLERLVEVQQAMNQIGG